MGEIAQEVDNMQWIVDILIDKKVGDEFVKLWADQKELAVLHSKIPTMYRHEINRITAMLCVAIRRGHILGSTDAVEGIVLNLPIHIEERLSVKAFSQMKKLRILKIGSINITKNFFDQLSTVEWDEDTLNSMPTKELRLMNWSGFPFKYLPMDFNPDNLVELKMRGSSVKQLWKGNKSLGNLKRLDLSGSEWLMETPDFSKAQNLEMIDLEGLKRLKQLDLSFCEDLRELPDQISLESLEDFILSGCSRLKKFPDIVGNMKSLELLYLDGTGIREVPTSFTNLSGLSVLSFRDCEKLSNLPSDMCRLSTLRFLQLSGCLRLEKFPDLSSMECLEELYAVGTSITQLSPNPFPKSIKILRLTGSQLPHNPSLMGSNTARLTGFRPLPMTSLSEHPNKSSNPFLLSTLRRPEFRWHSAKGRELVFYSPNESQILHVEVGCGSCEQYKQGPSDITLVHDLDNNRKWIGYSMFIDYEVIQLPGGVQRYRDYRELVETTYNWVPEYKKYEDDLSVVIFKWMLRRMVDLIFHQLKAYIFALLHSGIVGINEGEFGLIYQLGGLWNSSWIWID
ncbi:putative WRKY transcription factor 19 [Morella rubra]|uniref:Putative WRKY transcription factor 19 n=1 Tax=Morella rubra TaxID=262757 RepID=A0A6A1WWU3_9ROSI|nr:putative WRKY transcription factor 19 [Morella rubra]